MNIRAWTILLFIILNACTSKTNIENSEIVPHYKDSRQLFIDTKNRPDLTVLYLENNLHLLLDNTIVKIKLMESLEKIGRYTESIELGLNILDSKANFFQRGTIYFTLAKNYNALEEIDKARFYLDKVLTRNYQYYYFYYARMEEFQQNYEKSIELYEKALNHKYGSKSYILKGYNRTLNKAILYFKNSNSQLYNHYLQKIKENPDLNKARAEIIEHGIKF